MAVSTAHTSRIRTPNPMRIRSILIAPEYSGQAQEAVGAPQQRRAGTHERTGARGKTGRPSGGDVGTPVTYKGKGAARGGCYESKTEGIGGGARRGRGYARPVGAAPGLEQ